MSNNSRIATTIMPTARASPRSQKAPVTSQSNHDGFPFIAIPRLAQFRCQWRDLCNYQTVTAFLRMYYQELKRLYDCGPFPSIPNWY